ncbi:hypothetical protein TVAG_117960 [Trichomonas vaginalis G3]|uniref:Uncharacterized protein n=2 Tax=Trichomonas vaginalis (strain ATCC PRA-98 / G3) TaxID=412133 RepID=A2EHY3_TRIV3|nr:hypothetical protein TVAG_117960 [Trichomonas vaginalis G3]|eukprot:XP_001319938.1 hypothetical protein [Trichomonas vaginalis G3]
MAPPKRCFRGIAPQGCYAAPPKQFNAKPMMRGMSQPGGGMGFGAPPPPPPCGAAMVPPHLANQMMQQMMSGASQYTTPAPPQYDANQMMQQMMSGVSQYTAPAPPQYAARQMMKQHAMDDSDVMIARYSSRPSNSPEEQIRKQKVDGSWDDFNGVDEIIETKYGHKVASTVAAIAFIRKVFKDHLSEFSLIIKKALSFLMKQDNRVDWNSIINKFI